MTAADYLAAQPDPVSHPAYAFALHVADHTCNTCSFATMGWMPATHRERGEPSEHKAFSEAVLLTNAALIEQSSYMRVNTSP